MKSRPKTDVFHKEQVNFKETTDSLDVQGLHDKPSPECKKIWEGCKDAWKKIEADKKLSPKEKAAKVKALKEGCMKKAKAAKCKCPKKFAKKHWMKKGRKGCKGKKFMKRHFAKHPANPKCAELKKECKEAWKKIEADKKLSPKDKAAKVKALKEGCMKKAKALHCKKGMRKHAKAMWKKVAAHAHKGNMTCKDLWTAAKKKWEHIEHDKNMTKEQKEAAAKKVKEWVEKESKAMHCHKPHPHPHPGNWTCKDLEAKAKHMWEEIEKNKNLTKEQKEAKEKWVKEWYEKESKAMHCDHKPHPHPHPHPEPHHDKCHELFEKAHKKWEAVEHDQKLSKEKKEALEKEIHEWVVKESKAMGCKSPHHKN